MLFPSALVCHPKALVCHPKALSCHPWGQQHITQGFSNTFEQVLAIGTQRVRGDTWAPGRNQDAPSSPLLPQPVENTFIFGFIPLELHFLRATPLFQMLALSQKRVVWLREPHWASHCTSDGFRGFRAPPMP